MAEIRPELGAAISKVLQDRPVDGEPMNSRVAGRITNISHTTINELLKGEVRTQTMIRRFADGFKIPRVPLMKAAGFYPPSAKDIEWDRDQYGTTESEDTPEGFLSKHGEVDTAGPPLAEFHPTEGLIVKEDAMRLTPQMFGGDFFYTPYADDPAVALLVQERPQKTYVFKYADAAPPGQFVGKLALARLGPSAHWGFLRVPDPPPVALQIFAVAVVVLTATPL